MFACPVRNPRIPHSRLIPRISDPTQRRRPKVLKSVHFCEETQQILQKEYRDATSFGGMPTGSTYLTR